MNAPDTNEAGNVPEVSLPKSSDTKQGESIANEAGRPLKEVAREGADWLCTERLFVYDKRQEEIEAYGVACIKLGLERAKAKCDEHTKEINDLMEGLPGIPDHTCAAYCVSKEIDKEIESLKS